MTDSLRTLDPNDTYGRLLQIANANDGVDGTLRPVRDGKGDASALWLSTGAARVDGTFTINGTASFPVAPGGLAVSIAEYLAEGMRHVTAYGVDNTGVTDATAAIKACLEEGGFWYFPAGTYWIRGYGETTNQGGVDVTLATGLRVLCHPAAVFTAEQTGVGTVTPLDSDFFVFRAPTGGAGVPSGGYEFSWIGGYFDQTTQCVSTSVPFLSTYPPPTGRVGSSGTCEAISLRFSYDVSGTTYGSARSCYIGDVVFYAGAHWETAGGDSGIFIGAGSGQGKIERCHFIGCRDLGIYGSGIASGRQSLIVADCYFEACFGGISAKRGLSAFTYRSNVFRNCIIAVAASPLTRASERGEIFGNTFIGNSIGFRASLSDDNHWFGNQVVSVGATLADGTTVAQPYGFNTIVWLSGASRNRISNIYCDVKLLGLSALTGVFLEDNGAFAPFDNLIEDVLTFEFSRCLESTTATGTGNRAIRCKNLGAVATADPLFSGPGYVERLEPATGQTVYRNPLLFANGSASAPIMGRETQTNTGVFFGTSQVSAATNGVERFRVDGDATDAVLIRVNGSLQRVSVGVVDSGGVGFRLLRVPN